jgi:hypothetical protein
VGLPYLEGLSIYTTRIYILHVKACMAVSSYSMPSSTPFLFSYDLQARFPQRRAKNAEGRSGEVEVVESVLCNVWTRYGVLS